MITLDANHWPLTEAPDETREAIEGWIERSLPVMSTTRRWSPPTSGWPEEERQASDEFGAASGQFVRWVRNDSFQE